MYIFICLSVYSTLFIALVLTTKTFHELSRVTCSKNSWLSIWVIPDIIISMHFITGDFMIHINHCVCEQECSAFSQVIFLTAQTLGNHNMMVYAAHSSVH